MEPNRVLWVWLVIFVKVDYSSCDNNTSTTISPGRQRCEEQARLLIEQKDRYESFRVLQNAILEKFDVIESKTELSVSPANNRTNCTSEARDIIQHLGALSTLVQSLGRNVESITGEPTSCADVHVKRRRFGLPLESGVYAIFVRGSLVRAYCDLSTDGGGWTVFQRRTDGDTDFFRTWEDYKRGFGNPALNYWLGNDLIHLMTRPAAGAQALRVDMTDWNDTTYHVTYSQFSLGDENSRYELAVGPANKGNISDALFRMHHGKSFSTKDHFVNYGPCIDCPNFCSGAWWYGCCYYSNLNGKLARPRLKNDHQLARWYDVRTRSYIYAKHTQMKFRPRDFDGKV